MKKNDGKKKVAISLVVAYFIFATFMVVTIVSLAINMFSTILSSFGY